MNISVVIPAYNASGSLKRAIESCMRQTLPAHEIIIIDDASTDNTIEIVKQYPDIILLPLQQNAGPSKARNTGWDAATGDIIAFLDADDEWHEEKLACISKAFQQNKDIKLLGHPYSLDKTGITSHQVQPVLKTYAGILLRNSYQPSCIAVKKTLPLRFDESYRYCEDHELVIRVAHQYGCYWLPVSLTILGRPQLTAGGASGNTWKMRRGELRLYSSIYKQSIFYTPLIPFLWLFSLGKMIFRIAFR